MTESTTAAPQDVRTLSRKLQALHARILEVERKFQSTAGGMGLLDQLANDPAWAWLRAISALIADIDHATAGELPLSDTERAVLANQVRGLLFAEGDRRDDAFIARYRPLLQLDAELASIHGELRGLLRSYPLEVENESERLHARHQWAERCKHRTVLRV